MYIVGWLSLLCLCSLSYSFYPNFIYFFVSKLCAMNRLYAISTTPPTIVCVCLIMIIFRFGYISLFSLCLEFTLFTDGGRVALATTHWKLIIFRNKISLTIPNKISTPPGNRAHRHDNTSTTYKMRFIVCVAKNLKVNYHCKTPRMHNFKFVYVCEIYAILFNFIGMVFLSLHIQHCVEGCCILNLFRQSQRIRIERKIVGDLLWTSKLLLTEIDYAKINYYSKNFPYSN